MPVPTRKFCAASARLLGWISVLLHPKKWRSRFLQKLWPIGVEVRAVRFQRGVENGRRKDNARSPALQRSAFTRVSATRIHLLEVFLWQRIFFVLTLPENCYHPPAISVVHQLETIDAALKGFRVTGRMTRLISAEHMRDLAKVFHFPRGLFFVEPLLFKTRFRSRDVIIDTKCASTIASRWPWACRNQPSAGHE